MFHQNLFSALKKEIHAGGSVYVPPTACLPSAYIFARVAAYVVRTGKAQTNKWGSTGPVRHPIRMSLFLHLESTS